MPSRRSVLIVTHADDDHVPRVEAALASLGTSFVRLNTDAYIRGSEVEFFVDRGRPFCEFEIGSDVHRSDAFSAVLFRHIRVPEPQHIDHPEARRLVVSERRAALEGCILALEPSLWINHPRANQNTRSKVQQLRVAARLGFDVPDTVVTADPDTVRKRFVDWNGQMVTKLVGGQLVGRAVDEQFVIHTTRVAACDLEDVGALAASPAIYQRLVEKACDVRVTVVGDKIFACRIASMGDAAAETDWRAAGADVLDHEIIELPAKIQSLCRGLLQHFGLHMAGIDLILRPDGTFVFLEINAAGQWAWIEDKTGQPIAAAIAGQLTAAIAGTTVGRSVS